MALTDVTDGSRIIKEGWEPIKIVLSGTVKVGDAIGDTGGTWVAADGNNAVPAQLVAGEAGVSGDTITAYRFALIGGLSGGVIGGAVFLSDTAGGYSGSAGTVSQTIGTMASATEIMVDPGKLYGFPAAVATSTGTAAPSAVAVTGPKGGGTTIATTGTGGAGSGYAWTGGAGGVASAATTAATGGAGGAHAVTTGAGGAEAVATVTSTGGAGGAYTVTTGAGGAVSAAVSGTATGGASGAISLLSGTGGAVTATTGTNVGGASGAVTLGSGVGGAASGATDTGGASGAVVIRTGTGGAGDTGGASGTLTLQTGAAGAGGSPAIGGILFSPGAVEKWRIDDTGNLSSAGAPSNVTADGAVVATGGIAFTDVLNAWIDDATHGNGTTTTYIGNATITTSSDSRVKTDVRPFKGKALDLLAKAHLVEFNYNLPGGGPQDKGYGPNARGRYVGMIAQDTIKWAPWVINAGAGKDCAACNSGSECKAHSPWHVEYQHLVPLMVKGIQELMGQNASLRAEIAGLRG